jgi:hypothetical protein
MSHINLSQQQPSQHPQQPTQYQQHHVQHAQQQQLVPYSHQPAPFLQQQLVPYCPEPPQSPAASRFSGTSGMMHMGISNLQSQLSFMQGLQAQVPAPSSPSPRHFFSVNAFSPSQHSPSQFR